MKRTIKYTCFLTNKKHKKFIPDNQIVVNSSKNTCRISIVSKGNLCFYTSVKRSPIYTGYERRLNIAAYTMALNFGRNIKKIKYFSNTRFLVCLKGNQKHAILGLLDSGIYFDKIIDGKNPSFNGCRTKKKRRL